MEILTKLLCLFLISVSHTTCANALRRAIIVKTLLVLDASQDKAEHTKQFELTSTEGCTIHLLRDPPIRHRFLPLAHAALLTWNGPLFLPSTSFPVHDFAKFQIPSFLFLRLRKIANSDYQLRHVSLSVCPSVHMEQLGSHLSDFHGYLSIFRKFLRKFEFITMWKE